LCCAQVSGQRWGFANMLLTTKRDIHKADSIFHNLTTRSESGWFVGKYSTVRNGYNSFLARRQRASLMDTIESCSIDMRLASIHLFSSSHALFKAQSWRAQLSCDTPMQ
jgi:hypothetical protein